MLSTETASSGSPLTDVENDGSYLPLQKALETLNDTKMEINLLRADYTAVFSHEKKLKDTASAACQSGERKRVRKQKFAIATTFSAGCVLSIS